MRSNVTWNRIVAAGWLIAAGCNGSDTDGTDTESGSDDVTAPSVVSTVPSADETDVALNRAIHLTFDEDLAPGTLTGIQVTSGGQDIAGAVTLTDGVVTFTPSEYLPATAMVDVEVTTAVTDLAGNGLDEAFAFSFETGAVADLVAPLILSTTPGNYATDIAVTRSVGVWFDEPIDPSSVNPSTFALTVGGAPVDGTYTFDGFSATFVPSAILLDDTRYEAVVNGVSDRAGNVLAEPYAWFFVTGTTEAAPGSIELQSAADFSVLASTSVISTGETMINGNLGVSPGTTVEGFPPGILNGFSYLADATATQAHVHLGVAYDEAAARIGISTAISGDVGGQTLAPGLYVASDAIGVLAGDLTLDGGGDSAAVWVFQIDGDLTLGAELSVALAGEARARNVYWQVSGEVMLGEGASTVGNVMANDDITLATGASLEGRALSLSGGVTIDSGTIVPPS